MDGRKYYVLSESNCKFESMTKEQILTAITQAVEGGTIRDVDTGFVTKIREQNRGASLSFWIGTTAEYNALEEKATNCFYICTDDTTGDDLKKSIDELREGINGAIQYTNNVATYEVRLTRGTKMFEGTGDKTVEEITAAVSSGRRVIARIYNPDGTILLSYIFEYAEEDGGVVKFICKKKANGVDIEDSYKTTACVQYTILYKTDKTYTLKTYNVPEYKQPLEVCLTYNSGVIDCEGIGDVSVDEIIEAVNNGQRVTARIYNGDGTPNHSNALDCVYDFCFYDTAAPGDDMVVFVDEGRFIGDGLGSEESILTKAYRRSYVIYKTGSDGNSYFYTKTFGANLVKNIQDYKSGGIITVGSGYAELFRWEDNNDDNENRYGLFVTTNENGSIRKLSIVDEDDVYILGVVAETPAYLGITTSDDGAAICTHGSVIVREDGNCQAGGYCRPNIGVDDGIACPATATDRNAYKVIEKLGNNYIRIYFK